jgi:hypothetical protein
MDLVKRIKKQNIAIMGNKAWMALGGVMCFGKWEVSETMPTACTDGKMCGMAVSFVSRYPTRNYAF